MRKKVSLVPLAAVMALAGSYAYPDVWTTGLMGWYDANAITGLSNGDYVSQWNDQSGSGNHISQSSPGYQPTYRTNVVNGLPVVRFDGSDILGRNPMSGLNTTEFTMFAVIANFSTANPGDVASLGDTSTGIGHEALLGYQGYGSFHHTSGGNYTYRYHQTAPGSTPYILEGLYGTTPTDLQTYVNGTPSSLSLGTSGSPTDFSAIDRQLRVGYRDFWLQADIAELLVYNQKLSDAARNETGFYLQSKYGISGTYTSEAPTWLLFGVGLAALAGWRRRRGQVTRGQGEGMTR